MLRVEFLWWTGQVKSSGEDMCWFDWTEYIVFDNMIKLIDYVTYTENVWMIYA